MLKVIKVSGSHYECGRQVGVACAGALHRSLENSYKWLTDGYRWEDYRNAALPYLAAADRAFPWVVDEIRGAADGAGMDFTDLFTTSVEEIFSTPPDLVGRCSDFAVCAPATGGHVLLAHNNDLSPATQDLIVGVEWRLDDHPTLFSVGVGGLYLSIGLNAAGVCLTGNELTPNDEKPGIPRLLIARALLCATTVDEAVAIALHPDRASSYNNLISTRAGEIVSVEASATDHELVYPEDGWLVHTNHYVHPRMKQYERMPEHMQTSISRYDRARTLMERRAGPVTLPMLQGFITDHDSSPASLCRHGERVKTVFSALIDLTEGTVEAAVGNPCQGAFERVYPYPHPNPSPLS
jgi:isopenicillin-N N-acyltransferase like protein